MGFYFGVKGSLELGLENPGVVLMRSIKVYNQYSILGTCVYRISNGRVGEMESIFIGV